LRIRKAGTAGNFEKLAAGWGKKDEKTDFGAILLLCKEYFYGIQISTLGDVK